MNIKKLFLSIILITVLLINGCASHQIDNLETKKTVLKGEVLAWAEIPVGLTEEQSAYYKDIVNDAMKQFTKLNPDVKISMKFVLRDEQLSEFSQEISRGAGPDIFFGFFNER